MKSSVANTSGKQEVWSSEELTQLEGLTGAALAQRKHQLIEARKVQTPQPEEKSKKTTKKAKKNKGKTPIPVGTNPWAGRIAAAVLLGLAIWLLLSFFSSPQGKEYVEINVSAPVGSSSVEVTDEGNGEFECPAGITKFEFNTQGVLQPPYPTLQAQPQRFCFNVSLYERFLNLEGALEDSGEQITGLEWLAKTIAYPDWAGLLDEVRIALTSVSLASNMETVGWIELPGTSGYQSQPGSVPNPGANPSWNTSVVPMPSSGDATPILPPQPTATPVPTVAFAEIPIPEAVSTPENPAVAALYPEGNSYVDDDLETTNPKLLMYQAMCKLFYPNISIAELQYSEIWNVANVVEFNNDEYGSSVLGPVDGNSAPREFCQDDGNCFQIYVREACILQVTGFVWGGSIDYGGGYKAYPSWAQARLVPLYGPGDGKTNTGGQNSAGNTQECYWHGLWFFPCEVERPQSAQPTATPMPYPTSTPFAGYGSLSDYINVEWVPPNYDKGNLQYDWEGTPKYWARSCPGVNGTTVRFLYGGTCTHEGASHTVDLQDVWELLNHSYGQYFVVRCGHPMVPKDRPNSEVGSTGVCFGPVK